jgi:hypothetical protein
MRSAGRAGPWIRAKSKSFGYVAAFPPLVQRPVRCAGAASTIRPHYSREVGLQPLMCRTPCSAALARLSSGQGLTP